MRFLFFILLPFLLNATEFSVATYNVENLFDMKKSGFEYKEYIPNTKSGWNEKMLSTKIKNLARVIKDINADIISLQEVENRQVLKRLNLALGSKKYPYMYSSFKTNKLDIILLSRFPIKEHHSFVVNPRFRPIHKVLVNIKGLHVTLFLNHWASYRHSIKTRMEFAKKLQNLIKKEKDFILLGDFNSPFKINKKGWGKEVALFSKNCYNLWQDYPKSERYSYKFYKIKNAIDHIIISNSLQKNYKNGTFRVHKYDYLKDKYNNAKRWKISKKGRGKHLGLGYSDHFALSATFNTKKVVKTSPKTLHVRELLKLKDGRVNILLKDVMVIDKNKYGVTIEDKNRDKIYIYQPDCDFELGSILTLHVKQLTTYKGKREIILLKCKNFH